jgi:ADP-ribose pyrophosphatase
MEHDAVARALAALGCPPERTADMADQLLKRARQLSEETGRSELEALEHLLRLMAGGWAAQARQGETADRESVPSPDPTAAAVPSVAAWPTVASKPLADYRIFRVRTDRKTHPRTGAHHDLFAIDCADWVNVVAVTPDDRLVMVEQFRHGTNTVELEVPGGIMDPEDTDPVAAGLRELREETGYAGGEARLLATLFPNPAIQTNRCHIVAVEGCALRHEVDFDPMEDLATRLAPVAEIPQLLRSGRVKHAIVVAALSHYWFARACAV